jgi:methyl-accepting chemotaxis protein
MVKAMHNLGLLKKFWILGGIFLVVLIFEIGSVLNISGEAESLIKHDIPLLNKSEQAKLAVVQVQQWLTDISATRGLDGLNDGFDEAENNAKLFRSLVADLSDIEPANKSEYQQMLAAFEEYYAAGKDMATAYVEEGPAGGNKMMAGFDSAAAAITEKVDTLLASAQANTENVLREQSSQLVNTRTSILLASLVLGVVMLIIYMVLLRMLRTLPIMGKELSNIAKGDISGDGIGIQRGDEIGKLVENIEAMKRGLRDVIGQVSDSTAIVSATSGEVTSVATETRQLMVTQNNEVNQLAAAITEMAATAAEVARNAVGAENAATEANSEALDGKQVVDKTISSITDLSEDVSNANEVIKELAGHTNNIGNILDVIKGIAEQTNLLALNAAIEAARAGEQGRGFAVVADEVRTLAGRTQESTLEIEEMIKRLQDVATNAMNVMDKGKISAEEGVQHVICAGEKLDAITRAVITINEMNALIATASEQQSAVSEEVNRNITNISEVSGKTEDSANQLTLTSSNMDQQAEQLNAIVAKFIL